MYSQRKQRFLVDWDSVLIFFCGHVQGVGKKVVGFPPVPFLAQMLPLVALLVWDSS